MKLAYNQSTHFYCGWLAFRAATFAAVVVMCSQIAIAQVEKPYSTITAGTVLTPKQVEAKLQESQEQLKRWKEILEQRSKELGEEHPTVVLRRQVMEQMLKAHALQKGLMPLLVGERNDEKKAEISRMLQDLDAETAVLREHLKAVSAADAKLRSEQAGSELSKADDQQVSHLLAALRSELDATRQQLNQSRAELAETAKQIAKQDREQVMQPLDGGELRVFSLRSLPAGSAANALGALYGAKAIRVAVDDRTNSLIVLGKPDSLPTIEALLAKLDQTASKEAEPQPQNVSPDANHSLFLRLFWLAEGLPENEGSDPADVLPASVLRATKKLGLSKPRLVSQTVTSLAIQGINSSEFTTIVPAQLNKQYVELNYDGQLGLISGQRAQLTMDINVGGQGPSCMVKGSLVMPLGHYMVLGTANSMLPETAAHGVAGGEMRYGGPPAGPRAIPHGGEYAGPEGAMAGGMGQGAAESPQFSTLQFAFVVQVIEGESFAPEE